MVPKQHLVHLGVYSGKLLRSQAILQILESCNGELQHCTAGPIDCTTGPEDPAILEILQSCNLGQNIYIINWQERQTNHWHRSQINFHCILNFTIEYLVFKPKYGVSANSITEKCLLVICHLLKHCSI